MEQNYDIIIVGAGAVGCAIARELSRFQLQVALMEKEGDVACGTTGRNSAVVHAGFNNKPGSLMAELCVEGNQGFEALCHELDVPYQKTGKLLVAFDDEDMETLRGVVDKGIRNGCKGLELIDQQRVNKIAPNIGGIGGMYSPETAIFDPFTYCIALAENAVQNGVVLYLEHEVTEITRTQEGFRIIAGREPFTCRYLINSAGLYSDHISELAGVRGYQLYPCRGEYYILDKIASEYLNIPVYPAPKPGIGGLGVHLTPTIDGNIIIGPSAEYINAKDDFACTPEAMDKLFREAVQLLPLLERKHIIGNYSGIRPKQAPPEEGGFRDFVIKEEPECPGLINLIGIESPGLTASMPIARRVCDILSDHMELMKKDNFIAQRKGPVRFRDQTPEEQARLITEDPDYGEIICRCQIVTKKEIRQAIENPLGVRSISGIKYRAWATTGRCNGGYCFSRIVDILIHEYGMDATEIRYRSKGSELFVDEARK